MTLTQILTKLKSFFYAKSEVDTKLDAKASDSDVVHNSGDEVISGNKVFGKQDDAHEGGQIDLEKCTDSVLSSNVSIGTRDNSLRFFAKDSNGIYTTFFIDFQNRVIYCDRECILGPSTRKWADVNTVLLNGKTPAYADDLSGYLPRVGGAITGYEITRSSNDSELRFMGGRTLQTGGFLACYGTSSPANPGCFLLRATNGENNYSLTGRPDGTLTWGLYGYGKPIDTIEEQGDGYIRYSNGIQICWGNGILDNNTEISYTKPFKAEHAMSVQVNCGAENVVAGASNWHAASFLLHISTAQAWVSWLAIGEWE